MSTESVVRAFYASRLANDEARCMASYTPDVVLRVTGSPEACPVATTTSDRESACRLQAEMVANFEWRRQDIESITIQGDRAAVHYRLEAKFNPTGQIVHTELLDVITVRDGKIASLVEFLDTALVARLVTKGPDST